MHAAILLPALAHFAAARPAEADPCTNPGNQRVITSVVSTPLSITGQVTSSTTLSVCDDVSLTLTNVPTEVDTLVYCRNTIVKTIDGNGDSTASEISQTSAAPPFGERPGGDAPRTTETVSSLSATRVFTNSNGEVVVQVPPQTGLGATNTPINDRPSQNSIVTNVQAAPSQAGSDDGSSPITVNRPPRSTITSTIIDPAATSTTRFTQAPDSADGAASVIVVVPPVTTNGRGAVTRTPAATDGAAQSTDIRTPNAPNDPGASVTGDGPSSRVGFVTITSTIESLTAPTTFTLQPASSGDDSTILIGVPQTSSAGYVTSTSTISSLTAATTITQQPSNGDDATTIVIGVPPTNVGAVVTRTTTVSDLTGTFTYTEVPNQSGDPTTLVVGVPPSDTASAPTETSIGAGQGFTTLTQTATDPDITAPTTSTVDPASDNDPTTIIIQVPATTGGQGFTTLTQTATDPAITGPSTSTRVPDNPSDQTTVIVLVPSTTSGFTTLTQTATDSAITTPITRTIEPSTPGDQTTLVVEIPPTNVGFVTLTSTVSSLTSPQTITRTPDAGDSTTVIVEVPASSGGFVTFTSVVSSLTTPQTLTGTGNPSGPTTIIIEVPASPINPGGPTTSENSQVIITSTISDITAPTTFTLLPSQSGDPTTVVIGTPPNGQVVITSTISGISDPTTITRLPESSGGVTTLVVEVPSATSAPSENSFTTSGIPASDATTSSQDTITNCFETITQIDTGISQPTTFTHTPGNILDVEICLTVVVQLPLLGLGPVTPAPSATPTAPSSDGDGQTFTTITQTIPDLSSTTIFTQTPINPAETILTVVVAVPSRVGAVITGTSSPSGADSASTTTSVPDDSAEPTGPDSATNSLVPTTLSTATATDSNPGPTFLCDVGVYSIEANALVRVDLETHILKTITANISLSANVQIGVLGPVSYNANDNYLYAVELVGGVQAYVVRIDALGHATRIGEIPYVPWNLAAIDDAGYLYLSANGGAWAQIDLSGLSSANYGRVIDSGNTGAFVNAQFAPAAWVYLPGSGNYLWSISQGAQNATLLRFDLAAKTWTELTDFNAVDGANVFGGLYANGADGSVYASESTSGKVWEFNVLARTVKPVLRITGLIGRLLGGTRCARAALFVSVDVDASVDLGLLK